MNYDNAISELDTQNRAYEDGLQRGRIPRVSILTEIALHASVSEVARPISVGINCLQPVFCRFISSRT